MFGNVLVTGAGGSAASNFIHSLSLSGMGDSVVGSDSSPLRLALSNAPTNLVLPDARDADYLPKLNSAIAKHEIEVVHAQPDSEVWAISLNRDHINASFFLPPHSDIELSRDKNSLIEVLRSAGIPVPESYPVESMDSLSGVVGQMLGRFDKVWVRAREGAGSRASLPVSSTDQAANWVDWWNSERGLSPQSFMVSQFLPGREFAYQSLWQDGELVVGQLRERVEYLFGYLSPSGQSSSPSVARTVTDVSIDNVAQAAVRAIGSEPHGIYCVDMKEDERGSVCVTEINVGRFFTTSNFFSVAGINMPAMAIQAARGIKLPRIGTSPLPPDLYWIRMVDMGFRLVPKSQLDIGTE